MTRAGDGPDGAQRLMQLMAGKWVSAAIAAAADLRVCDHLTSPQTCEQLAKVLGCSSASLLRLLRILETQEIVAQRDDGTYHNTELGEALQDGQLRDLAIYLTAPVSWAPWPHLAESIRSGISAFELAHGEPLFDYLESAPDQAALYHRGVDAFTRAQARALLDAFDFSAYRHVVDLGGGRGALLAEILQRWEHLRGTLFDREAALQSAKQQPDLPRLAEAGRVELRAGDFRDALNLEADVVVIKHVLHNWDDTTAHRILCNARDALLPGGAILVIDGVTLPGNYTNTTKLLDLEMLALCEGGHERSKPEFRRLLHRAGLRVGATRMLTGGAMLLVATPRA